MESPSPQLRPVTPARMGAGMIGVGRELVFSARPGVAHWVESRRVVDCDWRHAGVVSNDIDRLGGQPCVLVLRDGERRNDRRLAMLRRILRDLAIDAFEGV